MKPVDYEAFALCAISLETGARRQEVLNLVVQDVNFKAGTITLAKTKNGKTRHAIMTPRVRAVLEDLTEGKASQSRIFSREKIPAIIEQTVTRLCNHGLTDPRYKAVFHTFRHTFASWLAMSGQVTPFELMELMGHRSLVLTERYVHLMPSAKERGVKAVFG